MISAKLIPGMVFCILVAIAGSFAAEHLSVMVAGLSGIDPADRNAHHLVSGISLAVIAGMFIRNTFGVADALRPGISWMLKTGLRAGIVLLGFKLALGTTGVISGKAVPVVIACITTALVVVTFFNDRLRLPPKLGALVAVGTSICGVTAIVATGPAIEADENETSYAVACITIFGILALFTYPWVAHHLFPGEPMLAGIFLGTSIHDTSQVAGAGMIYQEAFNEPVALQAATVTKLIRNMSMAILIPLVAARFGTGAAGGKDGHRAVKGFSWRQARDAVPGFVLGFLGAIIIRSLADLWLAGGSLETVWSGFLDFANWLSKWALAGALAGIGLNTDLVKLRRLGLKPLLVGLVAASVVGLASWGTLSAMFVR